MLLQRDDTSGDDPFQFFPGLPDLFDLTSRKGHALRKLLHPHGKTNEPGEPFPGNKHLIPSSLG